LALSAYFPDWLFTDPPVTGGSLLLYSCSGQISFCSPKNQLLVPQPDLDALLDNLHALSDVWAPSELDTVALNFEYSPVHVSFVAESKVETRAILGGGREEVDA
jgi:hypothetical protein